MAQIDRNASARALFVTLTYPLSAGTDFSTCKRHLHAWAERFKRRFAHGAFIWRMELQKNGTPHFHLIVFGVPYISHKWLAKAWYEVAKTGNADHLLAGTEVRRVDSYKNALAYAAKYAAKLPELASDETEGRVWGCIGRSQIPIRVIQWELEPDGEARLSRFIRNMARSRSRGTRESPYPPRWLILHGSRGMGAILWATSGCK